MLLYLLDIALLSYVGLDGLPHVALQHLLQLDHQEEIAWVGGDIQDTAARQAGDVGRFGVAGQHPLAGLAVHVEVEIFADLPPFPGVVQRHACKHGLDVL